MKSGFSLVELSIVLVILGLLTGGILSGQSLIRAAELRSVSTEYQTYATATQAFRDKYMALPGDMTNATAFWGAAHLTAATCLTTVGTGTQTCNGDGDGLVEIAGGANRYGEAFTFWQHLVNAGLIEGNYTGRASAAGSWDAKIDINIPKSKLTNAGWSAIHSTVGIFANLLTVPTSTMLLFGAVNSTHQLSWGPALKAEEAWNIDTKMDDGKPGMGVIQTFNNTTRPNCADSDIALSAQYDVDNTAIGCSVVFMRF